MENVLHIYITFYLYTIIRILYKLSTVCEFQKNDPNIYNNIYISKQPIEKISSDKMIDNKPRSKGIWLL